MGSLTGRKTTGATCTRTPVRRRCASTAPTSTRLAALTYPATWRISKNRWATYDAPPTLVPRPHPPAAASAQAAGGTGRADLLAGVRAAPALAQVLSTRGPPLSVSSVRVGRHGLLQ